MAPAGLDLRLVRRERVTGEKGKETLRPTDSHGSHSPGCALQCRICQQTGFNFDNLIEHMGSKHGVNLRKLVRKMEREAKKNSTDTTCRICKRIVPKLEFRVRLVIMDKSGPLTIFLVRNISGPTTRAGILSSVTTAVTLPRPRLG